MEKLKFTFFGTPDIASNTLDILKNNGYMPSLIITSPDKPAGRGLHLTPSPVSLWAKKHNIECLKPEKITPEFIADLSCDDLPRGSTNVDLYVVVAYGKILPEALIYIPTLGTINIHYSLLPKWRGASPLEASLLNGDSRTGVSIQQMAYKLDSGPILATKEISIDINEKKEDLKNKLINLGGNLLCEIMPKIINKSITPKVQDEKEATYCSKINKEDGEIDIDGNPKKIYNKYRAFYGWPGTYFFVTKHNKKIRVKIKEAVYENNLFIIKRVTPEGKKEINYEDFLRQN
ncbi:MAG: methionyl-tRNA formyltransferase [Candidatus Paceibacterota bacterium]